MAACDPRTSVAVAPAAIAPGAQVKPAGLTGCVPGPVALRKVEPVGAVSAMLGVSGSAVGLLTMIRDG